MVMGSVIFRGRIGSQAHPLGALFTDCVRFRAITRHSGHSIDAGDSFAAFAEL
jgi:hypothetical protein